jgi:acyl carrier protein
MSASELPQLTTTRADVLDCLADALRSAGVTLTPPTLQEDQSLDRDMGVDSFQLMQVARHLEKSFNYRFSVADWVLAEEERDVPTYRVGGLVDFVCAELAKSPAA